MCKNRQGVILYFWIFILSCSFVFKDFGIWFLKNRVPKKPVTEREIFGGDLGRELSGPPAVWSLESQLFQGMRETPTPLPWIGAPHGFQNGSQVNLSLKLREKNLVSMLYCCLALSIFNGLKCYIIIIYIWSNTKLLT